MKTIQIECKSCKGTGLYVGMAERGWAAVVCSTCKGSGETTFEYEEFTGRKKMEGVNRVFLGGFGYVITDIDVVDTPITGELLPFSKYGCTYEEWLNGAVPEHIKFLYCPYIAYNNGMGNEPLGDKCRAGNSALGRISDCRHYGDKLECWKEFEAKK